ncbi:MAG: MerR family DNA-binding transcriptional regulator [Hyphomicrobiaceae bacterium]
MFTISNLAALTSISTDALRYDEREELIEPAERPAT